MPRFILVPLFSAALFAQPAPDAAKVIKDISALCESAKAYSFEGDLLLEGQRGTSPGKVLAKAKVRLAVAPGGKSFLRLESEEKGDYLLVSNGQKSWAFVPKLKQYTEQESATLDDSED